jgi:hypothetical protein
MLSATTIVAHGGLNQRCKNSLKWFKLVLKLWKIGRQEIQPMQFSHSQSW